MRGNRRTPGRRLFGNLLLLTAAAGFISGCSQARVMSAEPRPTPVYSVPAPPPPEPVVSTMIEAKSAPPPVPVYQPKGQSPEMENVLPAPADSPLPKPVKKAKKAKKSKKGSTGRDVPKSRPPAGKKLAPSGTAAGEPAQADDGELARVVDYNRLAGGQKTQGNYAEAESSYRAALRFVAEAIETRRRASRVPELPLELDEKGFDRDETAREFVEVAPELKTNRRVEERQLPADLDILSAYKLAEGALRNNLGVLYRCWGRYQEADKEYESAWRIVSERLGASSVEAAVLRSNIGLLYDAIGRTADAEAAYNTALGILGKAGGAQSARLAAVTNNLAGLYLEGNKLPQAEKMLRESLRLARSAYGNQAAKTGFRLYNLGWIEVLRGDYRAGGADLRKSLIVATRTGDPMLSWVARSAYAKMLERQGKLDPAIYFAKQAVATIQALRVKAAQGEGKNARAFQSTVEGVYRHLASLLVKAGRLPEADQAIRLLKGREYASLELRGGDPDREPVTLSESEGKAAGKLESDIARLAGLTGEIDGLETLRAGSVLTAKQKGRLRELRKQFEEVERRFQKTLVAIRQSRRASVESGKELQTGFLKLFGSRAAMLATIVNEDEIWTVLITPNFRKGYRSKISEMALNAKVQHFRSLLQPASTKLYEPRIASRELYDLLFRATNPDDGATLESDLGALEVKNLVWTLDGVLRYLPVAALYDGHGYLMERYASFIFTPASVIMQLSADKPGPWRILAAGVTKGGKGYEPLPGVADELGAIVRDAGHAQGVVDGKMLMDEKFTWSAFQDELIDRYPIVHISSHFSFVPHDSKKSHLLLGDLSPLSIDELASTGSIFQGVELLTLSACETAVSDAAAADGREVEGMGVLAQKLGAQSVLASLWRVSDTGTSALMREFYRVHQEKKLSKVEALRQAQLALLKGTSPGAAGPEPDRGVISLSRERASAMEKEYLPDAKARFSHPYYWAPFVLTGAWQ